MRCNPCCIVIKYHYAGTMKCIKKNMDLIY